jgi:hypothetical protein
MTTVNTEQLESDAAGYQRMLRGLRTLLASPANQGNAELLAELREALANNERDLANTETILNAVAKWELDETPLHRKEIASQAIIDAIKQLADDVALVPGDFMPPDVLADNATASVS